MNRWLWLFIVLGMSAAFVMIGLQLRHPESLAHHQLLVEAPSQPVTPATKAPALIARDIQAQREALDHSVWSKEVLAQEYEDTFVAMWDAMRSRLDDQYMVLAECPLESLLLGTFGAPTAHERNIFSTEMGPSTRSLTAEAWGGLLSRLNDQGYRLENSEWHHAAFTPADQSHPDTMSHISMKLFVRNQRLRQRLVISGILTVIWGSGLDKHGHHQIGHIDASHLSMVSRIGEDPFSESFHFMPEDRHFDPQATIDPVLVYDVNGDGRPDILLPSINTLLINHCAKGRFSFETMDLCTHPIAQTSMENGPYVTSAILGNFLGHGSPDLLECGPGLPPTLFPGNGKGQFTEYGDVISNLSPDQLTLPMCMTAGDIRGNGRLDLWIGQYRRPYVDGNLPVPYWDANDGYPSFLMMNDGQGHLIDATRGSGLEGKRDRRNYSASLFDLNGDGTLDLVTVNDFSGVDIFAGHGDGRFTDVTQTMIDQRASFGMSHTLADFDGDGRLDLFIAGMGSTTARRLEQMKLGRQGYPDQQRMRMPMAYGNRLLLGTPEHRFLQALYNDKISRTGWSWGSAAIDPDNSGRQDIYLSNGNLSRATAKDYCTRYWTQDIYMGSSRPSEEWSDFFQLENARLKGYSWNPFEHKALLMNEGSGQFRDIAYLMNLGFEYDGRQVLAVDFDGDGHTDLLEVELRPAVQLGMITRPVVHIYRNQLSDSNHWLDVCIPDALHHSPLGSTITVDAGGRHRIAAIVAGDSFRSQHPPTAHFGLGSVDSVASVTVRWSDGSERRVVMPAIDAEVTVRP